MGYLKLMGIASVTGLLTILPGTGMNARARLSVYIGFLALVTSLVAPGIAPEHMAPILGSSGSILLASILATYGLSRRTSSVS